MILKRDLLDGIDCLTIQLIKQGERIQELEKRGKVLEGGKKPADLKQAVKAVTKRGRGRPRKSTK